MSEQKWNVVSLWFEGKQFKESLVLSTDLPREKAQSICEQYEARYADTGKVYCVVPAGVIKDSDGESLGPAFS